jgi:hypothetical protein
MSGRQRYSRLLAVVLVSAVMLVLAPSANGATGASEFVVSPVLGKVSCHSGCLAQTRSSLGAPRLVGVKPGGILSIRGRSLDSVKSVLFLGGLGARDNTWVGPRSRTTGRLDVVVPGRANTGRIRLIDSLNRPTRMSAEIVRVYRPPPPPPPSLGLVWPVPGPITSPFGEWRGDHYHSGVDIGTPTGTPIKAVLPGQVIIAGWYGGYGRFTCIAHATISSCYAHMSEFLAKTGDQVQQGQVIGRVGCTGNCYGDHLHFEVRETSQPWATPRDPLRYLPPRGSSSSMGYRAAQRAGPPQDHDLPVFGF